MSEALQGSTKGESALGQTPADLGFWILVPRPTVYSQRWQNWAGWVLCLCGKGAWGSSVPVILSRDINTRQAPPPALSCSIYMTVEDAVSKLSVWGCSLLSFKGVGSSELAPAGKDYSKSWSTFQEVCSINYNSGVTHMAYSNLQCWPPNRGTTRGHDSQTLAAYLTLMILPTIQSFLHGHLQM